MPALVCALQQQEYGDCGRKAALTRPYKPLGTPDHSVRDRRVGLPGRHAKKQVLGRYNKKQPAESRTLRGGVCCVSAADISERARCVQPKL